MSRKLGPLLLLASACLTTPLFAQEPATQTPRDPNGVTGISPFWESINKGDAAFLAQDLDGATNHYQAAITGSPKNPTGHLRMAEVSLKKNEPERAQEFITAALRFAEKDVRIKAAASFLMAELQERLKMHDDAIDAWNRYKAIDSEMPADKPNKTGKGPLPPHVYAETADSRIAAIEAKKKLDEEYAAVRERIQANIDKADAATGAAAGTKKDE